MKRKRMDENVIRKQKQQQSTGANAKGILLLKVPDMLRVVIVHSKLMLSLLRTFVVHPLIFVAFASANAVMGNSGRWRWKVFRTTRSR